MPSLRLRIAILDCDNPLPGIRATKYGGYGGIFTSLLQAGASAFQSPSISPSDLQISTFDVVNKQEYPSLSDIDAVLLTGSKHNSFDEDPWILKLVDFTKEILEQRRVRIIGVCFGHQIVGRAMGMKVGRSDKGWEISVTTLDLTKKGQEVFGKTALAIHQMHRDVVFEYPEGVEHLAYTEKCAVHGIYVPQRFITIQGHPEFNEEIMREIVAMRHESGIFTDEMYKDAMATVDKYQDGAVVSQAFLRFLLE